MPSLLHARARPVAILWLLVEGLSPAAAQDAETLLGQAIYAENCVECHMEDAGGDDIAPEIAGIPRNNIRRAMGGLEGMPEFELTAEEVAAVHAYLRTLDD
ncbi:c-type cytochrome [Tropicimonas sediminicola]|uniref:Cytochrome C oxidase, cbb3-type, subunit III n=1 Tax=Tropicimonas sediminicola TaxID=1031541 RepID=A0A239JQ72_9RHOB|nr:cytochrome c [Tropicimonas sediminicola]SNT07997.1 Cytochrome C oxidase, cbb3-type, subunit III [Tropicimonas sediminicola]